MKKTVYEILKQSFYEINDHYIKFISALALQVFLIIAAGLFLPPFGIILAFLVMVVTQIGLAKYSLKVLNKKQEQIKEIAEIGKFTFSHIITFIIKTFQIVFFGLFLILPGIKKCLEYSQTDFVLADNPKLDTSEALVESKKLTHNSKGRVLMLFVTHAFLSIVLIAFSASVVLLSNLFLNMTSWVMITWFSIMSVFLLCIVAMPYYTISRTILYENLKTLNKFNKTPNKSFIEEVAQEFMTAFKPEKAKKAIKETATQTKEAVKDTAKKAKKAVNTATNKTKNAVKKATKETKKAVKKVADNISEKMSK